MDPARWLREVDLISQVDLIGELGREDLISQVDLTGELGRVDLTGELGKVDLTGQPEQKTALQDFIKAQMEANNCRVAPYDKQ